MEKKYITKIPTDMDVQALVDSQLSWEEEKQVLHAIENDARLFARYRELLVQKKILIAWWRGEMIRVMPLENDNHDEKENLLPEYLRTF